MASPVQTGSVRSHSFVVDAAGVGQRLDLLLRAALNNQGGSGGTDGPASLTRARLQRLIVAGSVTVNGRTEYHPGRILQLGFRVVCQLPSSEPAGAERTRERTRELSPVTVADSAAILVGPASVLFEDQWLLAVNKPAGLPTHATADPRRAHLQGALLELLRNRPAADADEQRYLGVHHRLDRDTSGVMVFSTHRDANAGLAAAFAGRTVTKHYLALCRGNPPPARSWTVRSRLVRISPKGRAARFGSLGHDGTPASARTGEAAWAETDFEVLERRRGGTFVVRAVPKTGRTHQIRVHLAEAGLPIEGDVLYDGSTGGGHGRVMLHAWQLELDHPVTGEPLRIIAPPPSPLAVSGPGPGPRAEGTAR
ncbi:MAG: RluA family pseudouridine synthase [Acidimicrobiales bacterium]